MILAGLNPEEAKNLLLSVCIRSGKRPLSPVEVALLFQKAMDHGANKKMCAQFVHLNGPSMISRFLMLLELSPLVQLSVDWGHTVSTISFSSAWHLLSLNVDEQEFACREIITNRFRSKEVEQVIQLRKRSRRTLVECLNEVIGMRPTITKVHVILGAIINPDVEEKLSHFTQVERDNLFRDLISVTYPEGKSLSGRLGTNRFSIVTDEQGVNIINPKQAPSLEHLITEKLAKKLSVVYE